MTYFFDIILVIVESSAVEAGAREDGEGGEKEGEGEAQGPVDPLQQHVDYYLQAEKSVEGLINIRSGTTW